MTLSDGWLFQPDPNGVGDAQRWQRPDLDRGGWRPVKVPMAWDFYDPVMDGYEGVGWYALALPADRVVAGAWQRLRFDAGGEIDSVADRFGVRSIETRGRRILLNGTPLRIRGVKDDKEGVAPQDDKEGGLLLRMTKKGGCSSG